MPELAVNPYTRRRQYGNLTQLSPGELILFLRSLHEARKAGPHYDVRMGTPRTHLFSWATRKELPQTPGESIALYQTPVHRWDYQHFAGEIPYGYGAGIVHPAEKTSALILDVGQDYVIFTTDQKGIKRYKLQKVSEKGKSPTWLLINVTPQPNLPEKAHYTKLDEDEAKELLSALGESIASVQPKIDGALTYIQIRDGKVELFSPRISKRTGTSIPYTERVLGQLQKLDIPKELDDSILLGELYAVQRLPNGKERILTPVELTTILNSRLERARELMKRNNVEFRVWVFDAAKLGKHDKVTEDWYNKPYEQRRQFINHVVKYLPATFHAPILEATTRQDAEKLINEIKKRQNTLTQEGVVFFPRTGTPMKYKMIKEIDAYIKGFTPGQGKYQGRGVGGILYSFEPEGKPVGVVGSGLEDELRYEMYKQPEKFLGKPIRLTYQEQFPSGALRAPVFMAIHD